MSEEPLFRFSGEISWDRVLKTRTAPGKPGQLGPLTIDVNTDHKMSSLETEDTMLNMLTFLYFFIAVSKQ